ncbi:MAG TPA: BLUF domain-containing protein [Burkholderiaceae bacterium]
MKKLIRIVYVSRSTFAPGATSRGLEPNIARILAKSRANNRKNGLVGVLYFGDGCFFQCLEGEADAVDTLYGKLEIDPRHRELQLISREDIEQFSFGAWSMKYIPAEKKIQALLRQEGLNTFDPYRFSPAGTRAMLALLHEADEPLNVSDVATGAIEKNNVAPLREAGKGAPTAKAGPSRTFIVLAVTAAALCVIALKFMLH